jgi:hypothetical protein
MVGDEILSPAYPAGRLVSLMLRREARKASVDRQGIHLHSCRYARFCAEVRAGSPAIEYSGSMAPHWRAHHSLLQNRSPDCGVWRYLACDLGCDSPGRVTPARTRHLDLPLSSESPDYSIWPVT